MWWWRASDSLNYPSVELTGVFCGFGTDVSFRKDVNFPTLSRQKRGTRVGHPLHHRNLMDITWLTERIAVGGGIWSTANMELVAQAGITHIIDMQIEFDDTPLAVDYEIEVLWNPTDDDFTFKPAALFRRGVEFAEAALQKDGTKLFIHCAAGVHRAPMMTLAVLCSMGWSLNDAMELIEGRRPVADFADVYVESVEKFLEEEMDPRGR
jgi:hypothetical protein